MANEHGDRPLDPKELPQFRTFLDISGTTEIPLSIDSFSLRSLKVATPDHKFSYPNKGSGELERLLINVQDSIFIIQSEGPLKEATFSGAKGSVRITCRYSNDINRFCFQVMLANKERLTPNLECN